MAIRILIVDDHFVVRQGLKMFLALDAGFSIVGDAANGADAVTLARQLHPDVVLMDLIMPVLDGVYATQIIRRESPDTEVIALTSVLEDHQLVSAMKAGAIGFLVKDTRADDLSQAIRAAAAGRVQLSPQTRQHLLQAIFTGKVTENLTEQETAILHCVAQGLDNEEIAGKLHLSVADVKAIVHTILLKLGVSGRTEAVLFALRMGIISIEES